MKLFSSCAIVHAYPEIQYVKLCYHLIL